jgi:hypothetical protein
MAQAVVLAPEAVQAAVPARRGVVEAVGGNGWSIGLGKRKRSHTGPPCGFVSAKDLASGRPGPLTVHHGVTLGRVEYNAVCNFHSLSSEAKSNGRCPKLTLVQAATV